MLIFDVHIFRFPHLDLGGRYKPPNCTARHRVAIIVPYRDREEHLRTFLLNIHAFLKKQMVDYGVFIVEQWGKETGQIYQVQNHFMS